MTKGERWRPDDGRVQDQEIQIAGHRVVAEEHRSLITPWTETRRYGMRKNGYHGGVNPQEMVVPASVLLNADTRWPKGWVEAPVQVPAWWEETFETEPSPAPTTTPAAKVPSKPVPEPLGPLFPSPEPEPAPTAEAAVATSPHTEPAWIQALLAAPLFAEQKKTGGRAVPDNDVFRRLLSSLSQRGGKMTATALARVMQRPPHRLAGLLAVAQRVLNIDGYPVLSRDEASDTVQLNIDLLRYQFGLEEK